MKLTKKNSLLFDLSQRPTLKVCGMLAKWVNRDAK